MDTLHLTHGDRRQKDIWRNLYMVRHGESTANEVNRFAGAIDAPLTELGRAQARRAGGQWRGGKIDQVYVSPLNRACQTAEIILGSLPPGTSPPITEACCDNRICERFFGEFTLQNKTRLQRRFGLRNYEASLYQADTSLHGGESFDAFRARVLDFLKTELHPALLSGKKVLVVAHKYVIELLSRLILRLSETEGYDLRLPNARILAGDELARYVHAESPEKNLFKDWIVVHHSVVLSGAAVLGLSVNLLGLGAVVPSWLLLSLLMVATTISLARISLRNPSALADPHLLSPRQLVVRFLLLPWAVTLSGSLLLPMYGYQDPAILIAVTLLLAAPTAVTATILSRSSGGMILPSVFVILLSTVISAFNTIALLAWYRLSDLTFEAMVFVGLSVITLLIPLLVAYLLRALQPIGTAKFAEEHAATAVMALAIFVLLAFQNIEPSTFYPMGLIALAIGLALRLLAVRIARHRSLYSLDDYFSVSYPNIFLVILLAKLVGDEAALNMATWFLVPMFIATPLDDLLIRRLQKAQPESRLRHYLRILQEPVEPSGIQAEPAPEQDRVVALAPERVAMAAAETKKAG